jgi:hypothetical protein
MLIRRRPQLGIVSAQRAASPGPMGETKDIRSVIEDKENDC